MNIRWNPNLRRFEAEFHDFGGEQPLVKAAGFKTDGPPQWLWYSQKAEPLTKLRSNKPATLTINADARVEYTQLKETEDRNAAVKALFDKQKKALKKKLKEDKQDALAPGEYFDPLGFTCLIVAPKPFVSTHLFVRPPAPEITCFICGEPVYSYEYGEGQHPSCLYCQKIVLDTGDEVC